MDTGDVTALLREVAERIVRPRFRALADHEVIEKAPGDLVTVADREAELEITAALLADDPGTLVVGEEAVSADPELLGRLDDAAHAWVVDPVDGTRNFVRGSPDYAVMVAELRAGVTERGWILLPEHDVVIVGERGDGVRRGGAPLSPIARAGGPWAGRGSRSRFLVSGEGFATTTGKWCCGVDYAELVTGYADYLVYSRAYPWDHAPGALFVELLGGVVRMRDGTAYRPTGHPDGGLIAAASPGIADRVGPHVLPR